MPRRLTRRIGLVLALVAITAASLNLRTGIVSLAPVLDDVLAELGGSAAAAGVLTALPGFMFALMGLGAVPLARRIGLSPTLWLGGALLTAGLSVRALASGMPVFFVGTTAVTAGIALGNVVLPAWIKEHALPRQLTVMTMLYTAVLGISSAVGPLSAQWFADPSWRPALGVWAVLGGAQVLVWTAVVARARRDVPGSTTSESTAANTVATPAEAEAIDTAATAEAIDAVPIWKSGTAVSLMAFFCFQATTAYVIMGWLPTMFVDLGIPRETASWALAIIGVFNILGGVAMPWAIGRFRNIQPLPVALALLTLAGWCGIFFAPTAAPLLWAVLLGIGGQCFTLVLGLLAGRTRNPLTTARLSGFVQPWAYLAAGLGPLAVGFVHATWGTWAPVFACLMAFNIAMVFTGYRAARNITVDEELQAAARA